MTENLRDAAHLIDDAVFIEDTRTIAMVYRLLKVGGNTTLIFILTRRQVILRIMQHWCVVPYAPSLAFHTASYRMQDEGIFVGASSALNVVAAWDVAKALGPGKTVVTMICDGAYRYQTRLFSKTWLEAKGLLSAVPEDCRHFVTLP